MSFRKYNQSPKFRRLFKNLASLPLLVGLLFGSGLFASLSAAESPREHLSLDAGWKFHLGDDWPDALHLENSGTGSGPASEKFSDSFWRTVNLPHDWAVELPFDWAADGSHGFHTLGVKYPTNSIAWYRRSFDLPKEDEGKRIWLTFDGVFRDTTIWVNGWCMRHHEGGYYPFREDITDVLHYGGKNTIAVLVDATKVEGWFYEGAGIYRHVWLDKTAPVAIAPDGFLCRADLKRTFRRAALKSKSKSACSIRRPTPQPLP
jgi:beta-galactosidase